MIVKLCDAPGVPGGKAFLLCDEAGEMIGNQVATAVSTEAGEVPTITVKFQIDGQKIRFEE